MLTKKVMLCQVIGNRLILQKQYPQSVTFGFDCLCVFPGMWVHRYSCTYSFIVVYLQCEIRHCSLRVLKSGYLVISLQYCSLFLLEDLTLPYHYQLAAYTHTAVHACHGKSVMGNKSAAEEPQSIPVTSHLHALFLGTASRVQFLLSALNAVSAINVLGTFFTCLKTVMRASKHRVKGCKTNFKVSPKDYIISSAVPV